MPTITGVSHVDLSVTDIARSEQWYRELLDLQPLLQGRNEDRGYDVRYLVHPPSGLVIGLEQHDENDGSRFDERRVGLDHLSFNVASRDEMDLWLARLTELGIPNSGVNEVKGRWDVLVLRDPDNIQLEFFFLHAAPEQHVSPEGER